MCGIAGFMSPEFIGQDRKISNAANRMISQIRHRGPDGAGCWTDAEYGVGLGHARLSVLDLSDAGQQPMVSSCGRLVLTFNGEIYNFLDLRRELEKRGRTFRGRSDTEVLLEACAELGIENAVSKCVGMFAFAIWDRKYRQLSLVRDRLGKKPLYYFQEGSELVFGSELSALYPFKKRNYSIDKQALSSFLVFGYVPDPHCIYEGLRKLPPGHIATFDMDGGITIKRYWMLENYVFGQGDHTKKLAISDADAIDQAHDLVRDSVSRRMMADVPVGVFLSGGLDSTTVAAIASDICGSKNTHTFSIGFREPGFNEADNAKQIAQYLGTQHHELTVSSADALACIPDLPKIYDEPFADSSQVPTYLLSKLARDEITVALSGEGGDEVFGGYNRYLTGARVAGLCDLLPRAVRSTSARLLAFPAPATWDRVFDFFPRVGDVKNVGDKLHKLAAILPLEKVAQYHQLLSQWTHAFEAVPGAGNPFKNVVLAGDDRGRFDSHFRWMQYVDTLNYLPNDILTKVDRASMAVSLEVRSPLLDHRIVQYCWSLEDHHLIRGGKTKWLLRQILAGYVPHALVDRPKMGFGIPLADWLRGGLRDWCEDLLQRTSLLDSGLLDPDPILTKWEEHKDGSRNWQYALWNVLIFQSWWLYIAKAKTVPISIRASNSSVIT